MRNGREWKKPQLRASYSKSLTRFTGLESENESTESILYETTFPLKQIVIFFHNHIQSEIYTQTLQELVAITQVS